MTKSQLDNLIHLCFNFHETMGVNLDGCDADYILEKWDKFIGIKPYSNDGVSIEYMEEELRDIKKFGGMVGVGREDIRQINYLIGWSKKWKDYDKVKEILYFLLLINSKSFEKDSGITKHHYWTPSGLVETFSEWIGNPEEINKEEYKSLHHNVKREIDEWLESTSINRDYKLNMLV